MLSPLLRTYTRQWVEALFEVAGEPHPMVTMQSFMLRASLLRAWGQFQQTHPLIVAPIGSSVPFEVGKDRTTPEVAATVRGMRMALAVNALGLPAVALPMGVGEGLPQAVQVIGPRYREDLCLDAAAALEDRVGILPTRHSRTALQLRRWALAPAGSGGSDDGPPEVCLSARQADLSIQAR